MIKIEKLLCPQELTPEKKKRFTDNFKKNKTSVWKKNYIERDLLESSNHKCVYCECKIDVESKYMEVEHFHDKDTYPDEVVEWDNLLPSCKRCNGNKGKFDTVVNAFINPSIMDPKEHLILKDYRLYPKTNAADNTINNLKLNDRERLVTPRFSITSAVEERIDSISLLALKYKEGALRDNATKNEIVTQLNNLMTEALPKSEYSATVATTLIKNPNFNLVKKILEDESLWELELAEKLKTMQDITLETDIEESLNYKLQLL